MKGALGAPMLLVAAVLARPAVAEAFDSERSQASFRVHLRLPLRAEGHFHQIAGALQGAPSEGWRVEVMIDGRNLRFDGPAWMEAITRGDAFLAVDRYPEIQFRSELFSDAVLHAGGELRGELLLRGRRRPVQLRLLPAGCARPGLDCELLVRGTISRHAFGMNAYRLTVKDGVDFDFAVRLLTDPLS